MKYGNEEKGVFSKHFTRQIHSSYENSFERVFKKFSFALPGNSRFPYITYNFLQNELLYSFNSLFPFGFNFVYIVPNPNDDHYIEVGVYINIPEK